MDFATFVSLNPERVSRYSPASFAISFETKEQENEIFALDKSNVIAKINKTLIVVPSLSYLNNLEQQ